MKTDLFSIGPLTVHGYGLMIGIGVAAALLLSWRRARERGFAEETVSRLAVYMLIFGFLGAKLLYIITSMDEFLADPLGTLGAEGFVVYGGIIAGFFAVLFYCRRKKLDLLTWLDLFFPGVALAQGFGRIGCFLAGCCYGAPTDSVLGVVFPLGGSAPAGIALWPTQLFSAGGDFIIAALLLLMEKKHSERGRTSVSYLFLYAVGRFAVEFFRDDPRGTVGFLSTSQFISVFIFALALALTVYLKKGRTMTHGN